MDEGYKNLSVLKMNKQFEGSTDFIHACLIFV